MGACWGGGVVWEPRGRWRRRQHCPAFPRPASPSLYSARRRPQGLARPPTQPPTPTWSLTAIAWLPPLATLTILWPDSAVTQRGCGCGSYLIWMLAAGVCGWGVGEGGWVRGGWVRGLWGVGRWRQEGAASLPAPTLLLAHPPPSPALPSQPRPQWRTALGVVHVVVAPHLPPLTPSPPHPHPHPHIPPPPPHPPPLTVLGVVHVVVAIAQLAVLGVARRPHAALGCLGLRRGPAAGG
jgi:hypothetical protein